jgi:ABC-type oligopeptide transport system substrate-binding subunit
MWPIAYFEGKNFDYNKNIYEWNSMGAECFQALVLPDSDWNFYPGDADSWETSADGLTWTFHLNPNRKWSDGSQVTAHDYEFTFKRLMNPETANNYAWFYYTFKNAKAVNTGELPVDELGVKALDDLTLTITTEAPVPYLLMIVAFPTSWPVNKAMVEKLGDEWSKDISTVLTNGPYVPTEWNRGKNLISTLNPNYTGPKKPMVEKVVTTFIQQGAPLMPMYQADELYNVGGSQQADYVLAINNNEMRKEIDVYSSYRTFYVWFNSIDPPFDDIRVRQAVSMSIDRKAITEQVTMGMNNATLTMIPPGIPCSSYGDADIQKYGEYNPEKARELMAEAGYPNGEGFPELEMWTKQGEAIPELEAIQSMLKQNLGITVIAKDMERAVYVESMIGQKLNIALARWAMDYPDPSNFLGWWTNPDGYIKWDNDEFDALVTAANSEIDADKRCDMYKQAERMILEDAAAVFIEHPKEFTLWKPWVGGPNVRADGVRVAYTGWHADVYIKNNAP